MKNKGKWIKISMVLVVLCLAFINVKAQEKREIEVVFTHDLHSHLEGFTTEYEGEMVQMGGFARMKTVLDQKREENPDLLVLDGGDFSMGTLYQTIYEQQASELRMLGYLGFDAVTLGNHEFDYRTKGLVNMMNAAKNSGEEIPPVVLCNAELKGTDFDKLGLKPYVVVTKGKVKVAVLGVFGEDALVCAPTCELAFRPVAEGVKETVATIKEKEDVDMIVCVSHCGTSEDPKKSEDELLAKAVPELDLIISGHTHSLLEKPIQVGNTWIVSTGEYGSRIGNIKLEKTQEGRWDASHYELIPLTKAVSENKGAKEKIAAFRSTIDTLYLNQFGYTLNQVLTYNPWEFTPVNEIGKVLREEPLGNLLSDAYIYSVKKAEKDGYIPVVAAIIPSGVIRDTFAVGEVTVTDAFDISSLGIGPDGVPGYPLVSIYLTGKELKTAAEIDASIAPLMNTAQLYSSGLQYKLNKNRMILNKVMEASLIDENGKEAKIDNKKLYRVVAD
ncbi:MAG: 5'-nucleotidase C-terminal domain-containing protein, partial [Acetivibrio sp.]